MWFQQRCVGDPADPAAPGRRYIRIGPSLLASATAGGGILVEKFGIKPISTAKEDLAAIPAATEV